MHGLLACVAALAGCQRVFEIDSIDVHDARDGDAAAPDCYGTGLLMPCFETEAPAALALGGVIDTTTSDRCTSLVQAAGPELCVIRAQAITVIDAVVVSGTRPLVLISDSLILITGSIDLSSSRSPEKQGPGAQTACNPGGNGGNGSVGRDGAGGGAGGSFNFEGGFGANGAGGAVPPVPAVKAQPIVDVRGGCPGYLGGIPGPEGQPAPGGVGGGAFYAIARGEITVAANGMISAGGSGGAGGNLGGGGGGGGGTGGLIVLDGSKVTVAGEVTARGGGGGGGATTTTAGQPGGDAVGSSQAQGGSAGGTAGRSGAPGCDGRDGGRPDNGATAGGGGGGGACGLLRVYGPFEVSADAETVPSVNSVPAP